MASGQKSLNFTIFLSASLKRKASYQYWSDQRFSNGGKPIFNNTRTVKQKLYREFEIRSQSQLVVAGSGLLSIDSFLRIEIILLGNTFKSIAESRSRQVLSLRFTQRKLSFVPMRHVIFYQGFPCDFAFENCIDVDALNVPSFPNIRIDSLPLRILWDCSFNGGINDDQICVWTFGNDTYDYKLIYDTSLWNYAASVCWASFRISLVTNFTFFGIHVEDLCRIGASDSHVLVHSDTASIL